MNLAVSNIAWPPALDDEMSAVFARCGVRGLEVAPTKIWPDPLAATPAAVDGYRLSWERRGIPIVAAQALLFGRPDLTLFESPSVRGATANYLAAIIRLCADLGARSLVFGSPKNRRIGTMPREQALDIAVDFFGGLAGVAHAHGTTVVLEANPEAYGGDFITRTDEALAIVRRVDHPGLRLHLDTGCATLAGEEAGAVVRSGLGLIGHFHVSEPGLAAIGAGGAPHADFAAALQAVGYDRWLSIEMREPALDPVGTVEAAIGHTASIYGAAGAPG